jgi:hypothetical protein
MANILAPVARQRAITDLGVVAPGALLHTYVSGTPATPLSTTSDGAGLVPNANPLVASAGGLFGPIYLPAGVAYHFVLTDAAGNLLWDQDPVIAGVLGGSVAGNLTVGGVLTVQGFGTHSFVASGTGANQIGVQNLTAGPTNFAGVIVGNNISASILSLRAYSSTYAPFAYNVPNGGTVTCIGDGGLALAADHPSGAVRIFTGGTTERMRLAASGEVMIPGAAPSLGTTFQLFGSNPGIMGVMNVSGTLTNYVFFYNASTAVAGSIQQTTTSTIAYNTSSDARLKTDRGPATDLAGLRAVVVHDFTWTAEGIPDRGIFAQEAHALYPRAISPGTDDRTADGALARPWMTDYSKFVPDLIAGWQQHDAALAELRAAVAALRDAR